MKGVGPYPFTLLLGNNSYTAVPMKVIPLDDEIHGAFSETYKWHFNLDWTDEGIEKYYNKSKVSICLQFTICNKPGFVSNSSGLSLLHMRALHCLNKRRAEPFH